MKKLSLLIILLFYCAGAHAQVKELILGRWDLVETIKDTTNAFEPLLEFITDDPEDLGKTDKTDTLTVFFFAKGDEFQDRHFGRQYRARYRFITDEVIVIGDFTYQILVLTANELKLQPYQDEFELIGNQDILVFQKSTLSFKLIKEFEHRLTHHANGQKKEEGQLHNGFEHGFWKEWHPNGQLKSEREFSDGLPTGIWKFWDENGKLIKEENKNFF